jgi:hypothetical protein
MVLIWVRRRGNWVLKLGMMAIPITTKGIRRIIMTASIDNNKGIFVFERMNSTSGYKDTAKIRAIIIIVTAPRAFHSKKIAIPMRTMRPSASQLRGCSYCFIKNIITQKQTKH